MEVKKSSLFLLFLPIFLLSCSSNDFKLFANNSLVTSSFEAADYEGYKKIGEFNSINSLDAIYDSSSFSSIVSFSNNVVLPSTGEVPLLVMPISFSSTIENENEKLTMIKKAFFGSERNNQYVSVSQYYYQSSCSRLFLNGKVAPSFYKSTYSLEEISSYRGNAKTKAALTSIYKDALDWYKQTYKEDYDYFYSIYKEKIPMYLIYDAPYSGMDGGSSDRHSMMWAFTINDPAPICWSSYYMGYPSGGKMDAHTYIHEVGHLFGLPDYYDSISSTPNKISPLGRMDMMDCSLGDHNAFSKMLLNWARPFYPERECEITIHQGSGNNECILLSSSWNKTPFDQYLLLEFYTPSYLNYADSNRNDNKTLCLFTKPGVKAYLVDSRLAIYNGVSKLGYLNESVSSKGKRIYFYNDNSSSSFLIQLLDKSSSSTELMPFYCASIENKIVNENNNQVNLRDALFYEGEGMDSSFAGISQFGYGFKVKELTSSYAKISVFPLS